MAWLRKLLKFLLFTLILGIIGGALIVAGTYLYFKPQLPSVDNLTQIQLQIPLRIYSREGKLIAQYGEKRRDPVRYAEIPPAMVNAFLAAEDQNFFHHYGIDPTGLARAAVTLAVSGKKRQGGSTITMQVARNFYLTRKRTFTRKIREIFLALHIEQNLSKEKILELYLNKIYLGHRAYGIKAAAQVYYGKPLEDLTLAETAMIAGLPKAPSRYNPITNPDRARQRRNYVLGRMHDLGFINDDDYNQAIAQPVTAALHRADIELDAPYIAEMVREEMVNRYGPEAYTGGYDVYTTLSAPLQLAAEAALRNALESYDRRHGWRGAEKHFDVLPETPEELDALLIQTDHYGGLQPAIVTEVKKKSLQAYIGAQTKVDIPWQGLSWARPFINARRRGAKPKSAADVVQAGDLIRIQYYTDSKGKTYWRLAQIPKIAGALVSLNPKDGSLLALVGGYDFRLSKFNRATQARRQPGSGFKPVIYSAALDAGYTAASLINDAPVVTANTTAGDMWRPENYSGKFYGPTRLRLALTKSRNLVSIRLLRSIGINFVRKYASRFGFNPETLPAGLSLALGSGEVTPWQMSRAYSVLANGGYLIEPYFIDHIDRNRETLFTANPLIAGDCEDCNAAPRTIAADNRFIMYSMMQDVITRGTATRARVLKRRDLAGKTGTTNEQRDAWFNGFNQHIVANVWTGFDDNKKLGKGEVGGRVALPAWIEYMKVALQDIPEDPPTMPDNLVSIRIDKETGLQVPAGTPNSMFEIFRKGHEPGKLQQQLKLDSDPASSSHDSGENDDGELF